VPRTGIGIHGALRADGAGHRIVTSVNLDSNSEPSSDRLKDRFRSATRHAILEAAEEVFARDGVERARIDTIAARAGVSVGTIYNHIGARDAVFDAVLEHRRRAFVEGIERAVREVAGEDIGIQLERLARVVLEDVDRHRGFFAIVLESAEGRRRKKPPETVSALLAEVHAVLRRGVRSGALRDGVGRTQAILFTGMLRTAIRERLTGESTLASARWAKTITALFLDGASRRRSR
jgi:AcrR family transcriptional regulator